MNSNKNVFQNATVEIIRFSDTDVIRTSPIDLPMVPFNLHNDLHATCNQLDGGASFENEGDS